MIMYLGVDYAKKFSVATLGGRTWHGKIHKQGNKWLRWALVEAAIHDRIELATKTSDAAIRNNSPRLRISNLPIDKDASSDQF